MHGDLTPWNIRTVGGEQWLIDWEDAQWAPPGADAAYFDLTRRALTGRKLQLEHPEAALEFWRDRISTLYEKYGDDGGAAGNRSLLAELERMRSS